ncbi:hypothetical protein FMA36_16615 [Komagataeibacter xylinus]|uniref:Uncharacterized protein n=1 Tax=Komagataeibacter xylinus TaxID=28448 RepID=A0A857FRS6_KOMXY|nr:hypothetical protein FMA36_16615 [Komagataeibacter xylinus]
MTSGRGRLPSSRRAACSWQEPRGRTTCLQRPPRMLPWLRSRPSLRFRPFLWLRFRPRPQPRPRLWHPFQPRPRLRPLP